MLLNTENLDFSVVSK